MDQLKKELPKYLNKQLEVDKSHKSMAKILRRVASSEPNQKLQNVIYLYSQKHDIFEKERTLYCLCEKEAHTMMEESSKLLIHPLKVLQYNRIYAIFCVVFFKRLLHFCITRTSYWIRRA